MQQNELKKEIDILIDSIKKQADRMNTERNFSKVELEVFHHKIQKLYEKSILIHHLPVEEEKAALKTVTASEQIPAAETAEEIPPVKEISPLPAQPKQEEVSKEEQSTKGLADLFGQTPAAIQHSHSLPKVKSEKEVAAKLNRKPIPDLKSAISINDKFRLINELFEGNGTEFNIALNQINSCHSFEEADIYISNIRDIYKWPEEKESVLLFLDLVERRFL